MIWFFIIIVVIAGILLYWQLILAEGAYLGAPLVALLYDWTAERYNKIKEFDRTMETFTLGLPLANRLSRRPRALVLDIATGTGRLPLALFDQPAWRGRVIGIDRAAKMLNVARRDTTAFKDRLSLIQADATALPFADNSFYLATCLEALEFLPAPAQGIAEMVRVLQPASSTHPECGWLLFTNRIGWEAWLMPGKTWSNKTLHRLLARLPLHQVDIQVWQTIYDLVWAQKVNLSGKQSPHRQQGDIKQNQGYQKTNKGKPKHFDAL